jgi:hypothetical protein
MKATLTTTMLVLLSLFAYATGRTAVYIVTEQDEWQLYMGQHLWTDANKLVNDTDAIVIIYLTAGDKSCSGTALDTNYYRARQRGANKSLEFAAELAWIDMWTGAFPTINGHVVPTNTYRNITSYYLQLPGGCSEGLQGQSIEKLYNNTISTIQSVDGGNSYTRAELVQAISTIIEIAAGRANDVTYNICEPDSTATTLELREHVITGKLALEAINQRPRFRVNLYKEVGLLNMPPNLFPGDVANKAAMLSQMDREVTNEGYSSDWTDEHIELLSRSYIQTITR